MAGVIPPSLLQENWDFGAGKVMAQDTVDIAEGSRVAWNATSSLLDFPPSLKTSRNVPQSSGHERRD